MTPETTDLVAALTILKGKIPYVCLAMTQGHLDPEQQTRFGDLLIQLGQLLQEHLPTQIVDGTTVPRRAHHTAAGVGEILQLLAPSDTDTPPH